MVLDYLLARDGISEGYAMVIDMEGSTFSHLTKVSIVTMRKFLFYVQVIVIVVIIVTTKLLTFRCFIGSSTNSFA